MYGISTGFGALVSNTVAPELQRHLQVNLLRSHAAGTGADLPAPVVRGAMAVRANGLLLGHSGVRPLVVERVVELLNAGYVPRVPRTGSLGASGDLAPSAHAFLPLLGEGEAFDPGGRLVRGAEALRRARARAAGAREQGGPGADQRHAFHERDRSAAQRPRGRAARRGRRSSPRPPWMRCGARCRPSIPACTACGRWAASSSSAANIAAALTGSARTAGPGSARLQDAYSLRCAAQVHGAAREGHRFFSELVHADLNAVTDNPLVFEDPLEVISAGNFHGQSLALAFDTLRLALADLGSISERRTFRLLSPTLNGRLPAFLTADAGTSSGYMVVQYTAAALVAELRALAHPVSVDTIPTSDNQEDHVSMGMTAALMALEAVRAAREGGGDRAAVRLPGDRLRPGRAGRGVRRAARRGPASA